MAESIPTDPRTALRSDREIKRRVKELAQGDNATNFVHIGGVYLVIAATMSATIWIWGQLSASPYGWIAMLPLYILAVLIIGASQHQLAGAGHEGSHHTLFRHRLLNELASDILCMFPLFSSTFQFRLYHLQHHQFVNDRQLDPDFAMLERSGHWMHFPVSRSELTRMLLKQATIWPLLRHILARARYNAIGSPDRSPYLDAGSPRAKVATRLALVFFVGMLTILAVATRTGNAPLVFIGVPALWLAVGLAILALPADCFSGTKLKPVIPTRYHLLLRTGYFALLFTTLGGIHAATGLPLMRGFLLLWIVPLLTAFPLCLIMRQLVQHGNADRGWLTNTRVFHVNPVLRYAIFPFGMDYHLPHHMYATVPHFRLKALHRTLSEHPEYAEACVETDNYLVPSDREPRRPTVAEVLGPDYAPKDGADIFIDEEVLSGLDPANEAFLRETGRAARAGE
ncbi:MAG TPA: fatty acid desaturase [Bacteroidia bacterium]|nr:fatty acid desaturase [Bacteroidia bacterium]